MEQASNSVEVSDLQVTRGGQSILSNVSFTAVQGEITIILGASGSGKSTILQHILGLHPIQHGSISILGQKISTLTEQQQQELYLKMGVFYQDGALLNSMTVGENVALPLEQHSQLPPELIKELVNMKLGLVNLEDAYYQYPSQLSGGMLKRAALARAIIRDPPLLFCDEPGAGLDPISLRSLDELILNLKDLLGITIVMVTHEVTSIMRLANKIVLLKDGVVAFEGTPGEIRSTDQLYIKEFLRTDSQVES